MQKSYDYFSDKLDKTVSVIMIIICVAYFLYCLLYKKHLGFVDAIVVVIGIFISIKYGIKRNDRLTIKDDEIIFENGDNLYEKIVVKEIKNLIIGDDAITMETDDVHKIEKERLHPDDFIAISDYFRGLKDNDSGF